MSSTKAPKGKFINAFQSIQMISDYVEPEAPPTKGGFIPIQQQQQQQQQHTQNNTTTTPLTMPTVPPPPPAPSFNPPLMLPPFDGFPMPPVPPPFPGAPPMEPPIFPPPQIPVASGDDNPPKNNLQDEIAKFVSETNSIGGDGVGDAAHNGSGGDELYNPLEDMDEGSDLDESQMDIADSPNTTGRATFNSTRKDDLDTSVSPSFNTTRDDSSIFPSNTIELPSTFELPNFTVSSPSTSGDEGDNTTRNTTRDTTRDTTRRSSFDESDLNTTGRTSMNTTGFTSMNTTTNDKSKANDDDDDDDGDSLGDNFSEVDSADESINRSGGGSRKKKLSEHDIDLAIDLITDRKKELNRSKDDDDDEDEEEALNDEERDMFLDAGVDDKALKQKDSKQEKTSNSDHAVDYSIENKKSPADMYSGALQDISDIELSEKDEGGKGKGPGDDELLGAALAELDAEEKAAEADDLKKKLSKVKGTMDKVKKKKKKKEKKKEKKKKEKNKDKNKDGEKKEKDGTKEEKKKKKKKKDKKKEKKEKDKTLDGTEKEKKEKKKKKKSEKKSKEEKRISEISISSVIKEINKEAKEKEKEKSKSETKKSKSKGKDDGAKGSSKDKKKEEKRKNRDKKDEKRDKSHDKDDKRDRKLHDRSNSTTDRVKDKKEKKDKKNKKDGKENKENKENKDKSKRGKKRGSRESSVEGDKKRTKKDGDEKRSRSKERSKKRRGSKRSSKSRDSPEDKERRRTHSESRKSVSEKDGKSPAKEVDYHIGFPARDERKKSGSPPVLSMSEFYEIQNQVRKLRGEDSSRTVGRDGQEDSTQTIRENLEESRKFRESIENSHKSHTDSKEDGKRTNKQTKPNDNAETLKRLRENLAEIHNFREKMTDSRKMRDTQDDKKLRDNLMQETKKLQQAIKQREKGTRSMSENSDDIEIVDDIIDSKKGIKKLDIVEKPGKSVDKLTRKKPMTAAEKDAADKAAALEDTKQTRSMLREDYNRELDKYRREHEQKLKQSKELRKKEQQQQREKQLQQYELQLQEENKQKALGAEETTENTDRLGGKTPPPPPPPHKRTRKDSGKSSESNPSQSFSLRSGSVSSGDEAGGCTPENIINEIEQADMFVEEQQQLEEQRISLQQAKDAQHEDEEESERLEIDMNTHDGGSASEDDEGESGGSDAEKERKPGHMSLKQYKQRKKSLKKGAGTKRRKSSSSMDALESKDQAKTEYAPDKGEKDDAEPDEDETRIRERTFHSPMTEEQNQEELDRLVASRSPTPGEAREMAGIEQSAEDSEKTTTSSATTTTTTTTTTTEPATTTTTTDIPTVQSDAIPLLSSEDAVPHDDNAPQAAEEVPSASPISQTSPMADVSYNPELASTWKEISDAEAEAGAGEVTYNPETQMDNSWNEGTGGTNESDAEVVPSPIESLDSPYNPEFASPFDIGSPPRGATAAPGRGSEDVEGSMDFRAYKDVVAFNDIMKSKVKQQAKKHRRSKKIDDMINAKSGGGSKKERKLVDHLIRQSQVEEEMKNVLKQYFKSRDITKEEYKNILKKAVPQVTMSNSPIIPDKIQSLMVKFVRKCKGQRVHADKQRRRTERQTERERELAEQQKELQLQLQANAAILDSLTPQARDHALNPNLPLPPV